MGARRRGGTPKLSRIYRLRSRAIEEAHAAEERSNQILGRAYKVSSLRVSFARGGTGGCIAESAAERIMER
jgi:hypothetical protein